MPYLADILQTLAARLPELEWRLGEVGKIHVQALPKGLFQSSKGDDWIDPLACIQEIKQNLMTLNLVHESSAGSFLALKISQKINVLLRLCQMHRRKAAAKGRVSFEMNQLATRQQWLETLEKEIERLSVQQTAILSTLEKNRHLPAVVLTLQQELGELTRQLTLVQTTRAATIGA